MELIDLIHEELLKSPELTGIWEKKLRDIEHQQYDAQQFIDELKGQVSEIVQQVLSDPSNRRVTILTDADLKKKMAPKAEQAPKPKSVKKAETTNAGDSIVGQPCPQCGKGHIIKGRTAYGCSRWNDPQEPCSWRQPFEQSDKVTK